jgi:rubrerythrin
MPLTNFGAVLNFAEDIEAADAAFYQAVGASAGGDIGRLLTRLAQEAGQHAAIIQRTRRENVTEMILEPITGLSRRQFLEASGELSEPFDAAAAMDAARRLENRAIRYYTEAAERIGALPEVVRALKQLAKKHHKRLELLA